MDIAERLEHSYMDGARMRVRMDRFCEYHNSLTPEQRFISLPLAEMGLVNLKFRGADVVCDPALMDDIIAVDALHQS